MRKFLNLITNTNAGSGCGACATTSCGSCGSEPAIVKPPAKLGRRDLGKAVLAATAGLAVTSLSKSDTAAAQTALAAVPLDDTLNVVQKSKGPIMTVLDEFYKIGPGPSSSHTMGPMRITYDFFQRVSKLPEDQLKRATGLKVHLYGSLSQTGEGHGTNRAD